MISIRGSIPDKIINEAFETHTNFVIKEVNIRIDFYINLFETIKNIKKNTKKLKNIYITLNMNHLSRLYILKKNHSPKKNTVG